MDSGPPDGGTDAGPPDAGPMDAGPSDAGPGDSCVSRTFYADADGDGFGDPTVPMMGCEMPEGFVENDGDCNDDCRDCFPGGTEVCEGSLDEDCAGGVDDGCDCTSGTERPCPGGTDTGECSAGTQRCEGGTWSACEGAVGPATEECDTLDNDCDGTPDGPAASLTCPSGANVDSVLCSAGSCLIASCVGTFRHCDTSLDNGCETDTRSDRRNCGSCDNECGPLEVCDERSCVDAPVLDWVAVAPAYWIETQFEQARLAANRTTGQTLVADPWTADIGEVIGTLTSISASGAIAWSIDEYWADAAAGSVGPRLATVRKRESDDALFYERFDAAGAVLSTPITTTHRSGTRVLDMPMYGDVALLAGRRATGTIVADSPLFHDHLISRSGEMITSMAVDGDVVFAADRDGNLYSTSPARTGIGWRRTVAGVADLVSYENFYVGYVRNSGSNAFVELREQAGGLLEESTQISFGSRRVEATALAVDDEWERVYVTGRVGSGSDARIFLRAYDLPDLTLAWSEEFGDLYGVDLTFDAEGRLLLLGQVIAPFDLLGTTVDTGDGSLPQALFVAALRVY
ncbi:MAG: hypothetical protein CMN31_17855 [Sandaracinus sp.]|nr:hypothetical protein [Sandaracinus sp.]HJL21489.1 hypothetical protein [Polyangiaceae bacterium LLY-WYZ-15_(1-7)]HJL29337.1 hypothetical protein [Polyangiaceae bacterium LLY-WYZ-15_(1-7)]